jgi:hypothetical protein
MTISLNLENYFLGNLGNLNDVLKNQVARITFFVMPVMVNPFKHYRDSAGTNERVKMSNQRWRCYYLDSDLQKKNLQN